MVSVISMKEGGRLATEKRMTRVAYQNPTWFSHHVSFVLLSTDMARMKENDQIFG